MADASLVVRIGSDVSGIEQGVRVVNRQLGDLTSKVEAASSACDTLRKAMHAVTGITIAGAVYQGLSMLKSAMDSLVKTALDYNKTLENSRLGIAGILHSMSSITDASGRQLQGQQKFNAAVQVAMQQQKQLEVIAMSTAVTYQEIVTVYQALLAPAMAAKLTMGQTVTLTGLMANSVKAMGLPMNQIVQESRDMLTGNIDNNSQLAKSLGITREMIKEWTKKRTLFDEITKRLEGFTYASREFENTWDGAVSNLKDAFQKALGTGMGPLMQPLISGVKALSDAFLDVERNADGIVKTLIIKKSIIEGIYLFIANPLYKAWLAVQGAAETINELFIKQTGVLRIVTDAVMILLGWVVKIVDGWGWIISAVLPAVATGLGKINELLSYLMKGAFDFGNLLLNAMSAVGESLGTIMKAAWQGFTGDFKGAGETLGGLFKGKAVENMKAWSVELGKTGAGFKTAVSGMGTMVDTFLDKTVAWQQGLKKGGASALGAFGIQGNPTKDKTDDKAAAKALKLAEQYEKDYLADMEKWRKAQEQLADTYDKAAIAAVEQRRDRELAILKNQYDQGLLSQADYLDKQYQQQVAASDKALDQLESAALRNDQAYYAALKAEPAKPTDGNPVAVEAYNKAILLTVKLLQESEAAWAKVDAAAAKSSTAAIANEGAKAAIQRENAKAALGFEAQLLQTAGQTYAATLKQIEADKIGRKPIDAKTDALRDQLDAVKALKAAQDEANRINAIKDQTTDINIRMMNDPYAEQRAAMEESYRREAELIQQNIDLKIAAGNLEIAEYEALSAKLLAMAQERDKNIANSQRNQSLDGWDSVISQAQKAFPKLTGIDKAISALRKDYTVKNKEGVVDETKTNLSMYGAYTGAAEAMFEGLAATQDQTSRSGFETAKAFNIAAAVMSTAAAIMNAMASIPYPMNIAAAVATGVMGAIQIANIASTTFGGGAQAPSIPSGSFAASAGGGAASSTIGSQIAYVQDPYAIATTEALQGLAKTAASASLALGDVGKIYDKVGESFSTDKGQALADRGAWMIASSGAKNATAAINAVKSDPQLIEGISMYFQDALKAMNVGALALGLNAQAINPAMGRNTTGWEWGDWRSGKTTADVAKGLQEIQEIHMSNFAAGWGNELMVYAKPFENASEAIRRLSTALYTFNDAAELAGIALMEGLAGGNWASAIIENIGGLEDFNTAMDSYFDAMFTSAEQDVMEAAKATREVTREFKLLEAAGINLEMPKTREEFRALVEGLDLMSGTGATAFSSLLKISEAFGTMMTAADEAAEKLREIQIGMEDLDVRYLRATGKDTEADALSLQLSAQREIEQAVADNMGDAYIARLRDVLRLESEMIATAADTSILDQRLSLQQQIDLLTGATTEHEITLASITNETNKSLQERIWALQDENAATVELLAKRTTLQNQLDVLTGTRTEHEITLAGITDETNKSLQERIWALQDEKTAIDDAGKALRIAIDAQIQLYQDQVDAAQTAYDAAEGLLTRSVDAEKARLEEEYQNQVNSINAAVEASTQGVSDLKSAIDALVSARKAMNLDDEVYQQMRFNDAKLQISGTLASARKGDLSGIGNLDDALKSVSGMSADNYASSADYKRDYFQQYAAIAELETLAGKQLPIDEQSLGVQQGLLDQAKIDYDQQILALDTQVNALLGIDTSVVEVSKAIDEFKKQQAYLLTTKDILSYQTTLMNDQYNALLGINSSVLSVAAAIQGMRVATGLPAFATGGITSGPSIAGESGPEAVIPLPDGRTVPVQINGSADNHALVAEIRALRSEVVSLKLAIGEVSKATQRTAKYMDRWDGDGMPEVRTA